MFSTREIQNRVQSGYIERLGTRLRKMRKQLMDRDWIGLKTEAHHVAEGAQNFGYQNISTEVEKAMSVLSQRQLTRTAIDPEAKSALENLFQQLDRFLTEQQK